LTAKQIGAQPWPTVHRRKRRKQRRNLSLRSLRLLLFKTLSDPAPLTPCFEPRRNRGLRCIGLVRIPNFITQKSLVRRSRQKRSDDRRCHCARKVTANHAKHTKRNPPPAARHPGLQIQQEVTEETEDGVRPLSVPSVSSCSKVPAPLAAERSATPRH
jgi:hypothetical protein